MESAVANVTHSNSFCTTCKEMGVQVGMEMRPVPVSHCCRVDTIVSVVGPPVQSIILLTGLNYCQLVGQQFACGRRKLGHQSCHVHCEPLYPVCDNLAAREEGEARWGGGELCIAASCALGDGISSTKSTYFHH